MSSEAQRTRADLSFLAESANRCFATADLCESSLAAVGFRELGKQYLAIVAKLHDATSAEPKATSAEQPVKLVVSAEEPAKVAASGDEPATPAIAEGETVPTNATTEAAVTPP